MGSSPDQTEAVDDFTASVRTRAQELGWTNVRVGKDEFFAWVKAHPNVRVSPDTFVLDDPPPGERPEMWATWEPGVKPPRFALEVVSDKSPRKDLVDGPAKYRQLRTHELVIFDQTIAEGKHPRSTRVALTVWRRTPKGQYRKVYRGAGPAWSEQLEAWLVTTFDATGAALLRLARDEAGAQLIPTAEEALAEAERQRAEAERQRAEAERQRAEAERQRVEAERQRVEAERQRVEAEQCATQESEARQGAERARQDAEQARQDAERARQDAEQARREAEERAVTEERARREAEERATEVTRELARMRALVERLQKET